MLQSDQLKLKVIEMTWIFSFALHSLAVLAGAKVAKLERVDIWKAAVVAFLSYIAMMLAGVVLFLFFHMGPFINALAGAAVLFIGTTVTARMVWDLEWDKAANIGVVVMVLGTVASWFLLPFPWT